VPSHCSGHFADPLLVPGLQGNFLICFKNILHRTVEFNIRRRPEHCRRRSPAHKVLSGCLSISFVHAFLFVPRKNVGIVVVSVVGILLHLGHELVPNRLVRVFSYVVVTPLSTSPVFVDCCSIFVFLITKLTSKLLTYLNVV